MKEASSTVFVSASRGTNYLSIAFEQGLEGFSLLPLDFHLNKSPMEDKILTCRQNSQIKAN